ncbi:MAG TPA: 2-phosphosulfolactate phosphatase [Jatrophihabitans sp.]|nr:2-phosphosulfolactate phosphatase [Jatrophihabitans sp.]
MQPIFGQAAARVRFDWGRTGAEVVAGPGDLVVVVDVLSFSTAVSVAADGGIEVFPFPWRDGRATARADALGATLARGRREGAPSLSPAALREYAASLAPAARTPAGRLLLPSPNGSSISFAVTGRGGRVVAGCLRNASAVAGWLAGELAADRAASVAVIAAGERWPDGSLRPAAEDLWGAGAIIAALAGRGLACSPEATAAAAGYAAAASSLGSQLAGCASGLELIAAGFGADVAVAAELDGTRTVPVLVDGCFRPAACR